jgi:thiamine biosynthesis lipoprotein
MMRWTALGTTAVLRAPRHDLLQAHRAAFEAINEVDALASRFRLDSELTAVNRAMGRWTPISQQFAELVALGLKAADVSLGAVDPTLANELIRLGYDRDFGDLAAVEPEIPARGPSGVTNRRGEPWRRVELRRSPSMIRVPIGIGLDLGATAKGHAADLAAAAAHQATGAGVLVSLGGDVSVAGPAPDGGWVIGIAGNHRTDPSDCPEAVSIQTGGLATSSLLVRRWWHERAVVHHILDPQTGLPVTPEWTVASVTAATCAEANIAATAALVLGPRAPQWLESQMLPTRLVGRDGSVLKLTDWPS